MMPTVYARKRGWSSAPLATLLIVLFGSMACGSAPPKVQTGPAPEILALSAKAEAAERKREHLDAQAFLQQAVDQAVDPISAAYANRKMASLLLFWREEQQALPYLEKTVEFDPKEISAWNDLGVVYSSLSQPAKARAALERAVALDAKEPISRMALAAELVRQKDFSGALTHYKVLLTLHISPRIENATHRAIELLQSEIEQREK